MQYAHVFSPAEIEQKKMMRELFPFYSSLFYSFKLRDRLGEGVPRRRETSLFSFLFFFSFFFPPFPPRLRVDPARERRGRMGKAFLSSFPPFPLFFLSLFLPLTRPSLGRGARRNGTGEAGAAVFSSLLFSPPLPPFLTSQGLPRGSGPGVKDILFLSFSSPPSFFTRRASA